MAPPAHLEETLYSLREGIQVLAPDWRYLYINEAAALHGRKRPEELLGRTMLECYPGIDATPVFAVLARCMRDRQPDTLENEFTYDDGSKATFELRIAPCPEGLIVLSLDVTERKRMERSVAQVQKLRALGQMAVGVAHDLRNILNPIALNARILSRTLRDRPEDLAVVEDLAVAVRRGIQTIDLLRQFSRQTPATASEEVALDHVAAEAAKLCRMRIVQSAHPVDLRLELVAGPRVRVSSAELLSAILNLLMNAVEALGDGGQVMLRSGVTDDLAWVEVEDNGPGMPPDVEAHAFEPFFTTKGEAGTGLGLSMVYAFALRNAGNVRLRTMSGQGTSVTMFFPAAAPAARAV